MRTWRSSAGAGIIQEGVLSGDGRVWAAGSITWAPLPLPLAWMSDGTQHIDLSEMAPQIGTMEECSRDGEFIVASGILDDENPIGAELARRMDAGTASHGHAEFVSVDPDDWAFQVLLAMDEADEEEMLFASSGRAPAGATIANWNPLDGLLRAGIVQVPRRTRAGRALIAAAGDPDPGENPDGYITLFEDRADALLLRFTASRLRGLTCVPTPAFNMAMIELEPAGVAASSRDTRLIAPRRNNGTDEVLRAHSAPALSRGLLVPDRLPAAAFEDPGEPNGSLNIGRDGMDFAVHGYVALWDSCHNGYADRCVPPPHEDESYGAFHHGQGRQLEDGQFVSTGALTWGIPHADLDADQLAAFNHYADARHGFADVRVGANEHGIWHAGSLRGPSAISDGITQDDVNVLRALSLSGDWRYDFQARGLRMIAGLAVNNPGFGVPRIVAAASVSDAARRARHIDIDETMRFGADGQLVSLVAAGMVEPSIYATAASTHACSCQGGAASQLDRIEAAVRTLDARTRHLGRDAAADLLAGIRR